MKKHLLLGFVLLLSFVCAKAQLVVYNYAADPTTYNSTNKDGNVSTSVFSVSSGNVNFQASSTSMYTSTWPTSSSFSTAGKYFEFTITPNSGYSITITSFSFYAGRTAYGPAKIEVQYSKDGFNTAGTSIGTFDNTNTSSLSVYSNPTLNVTSSSAITFRIWGYNASSSGNFKINNILVGGASTTLPISLTSFTAKPIDETILLNWKTASEKNNQQFEVLKSADGKNFKPISIINGAGNSNSENSYSFVDENPYAGANYYQLKQTDFNGATATSSVISANAKIEGIKLWAYASANSVTINVNSPNQTDGEIALFDMNGRKLYAKSLALNKGYNEVSFNKFLAPGTYFVNLISAGKSTNFKFMK